MLVLQPPWDGGCPEGGHWCGRVEGRGPPSVIAGCLHLPAWMAEAGCGPLLLQTPARQGLPPLLLGWEGSPEAWSWAASFLASSAAPLSLLIELGHLAGQHKLGLLFQLPDVVHVQPVPFILPTPGLPVGLTSPSAGLGRAGVQGRQTGLCQSLPGTPWLGGTPGCRSGTAPHPLLGLSKTTVSPTPRFIFPCANGDPAYRWPPKFIEVL